MSTINLNNGMQDRPSRPTTTWLGFAVWRWTMASPTATKQSTASAARRPRTCNTATHRRRLREVTFDPKKPVPPPTTSTSRHAASTQPGAAPSRSRTTSTTPRLQHDFRTPHPRDLQYSPPSEHLVSREGLSTTTVDVSPSGPGHPEGTLLVPNSRAGLRNFDNRDARFISLRAPTSRRLKVIRAPRRHVAHVAMSFSIVASRSPSKFR